jgi:Ca2+-binding EF-hand superfamily protein
MNFQKRIMLVAAVAGAVIAWTGARADDRSFGDGTLPDYLAVYDVDGNGVLSVEEIQAMKDARSANRHQWLEQWDTNDDGVIDEDERAAAHEAMRERIIARRIQRFHEADTDGDGCLTFEEFSALPAVMKLAEEHPEAPARIYDRLDANDDDCVSLEEFLRHLRDRVRDGWRTEETYNRADTDEDGCLTLEEFTVIPAMAQLAEHHPEEPARIFGVLDADDDGCLTLEEFTARVHLGDPPRDWRTEETYRRADADHDGCLTREEFAAIPAVRRLASEHPGAPTRIYNLLDQDDDGCLTLEEFTADIPIGPPHTWRTEETYRRADVDHDGCLTREEFAAIPAVMKLAHEYPGEPARIYRALDVDEDGCLTLAEFTAPMGPPPPPDSAA